MAKTAAVTLGARVAKAYAYLLKTGKQTSKGIEVVGITSILTKKFDQSTATMANTQLQKLGLMKFVGKTEGRARIALLQKVDYEISDRASRGSGGKSKNTDKPKKRGRPPGTKNAASAPKTKKGPGRKPRVAVTSDDTSAAPKKSTMGIPELHAYFIENWGQMLDFQNKQRELAEYGYEAAWLDGEVVLRRRR